MSHPMRYRVTFITPEEIEGSFSVIANDAMQAAEKCRYLIDNMSATMTSVNMELPDGKF